MHTEWQHNGPFNAVLIHTGTNMQKRCLAAARRIRGNNTFFFFFFLRKKEQKTRWKWWIVSSVFSVLLSHLSHFAFFLAPSWQNPNGPSQSVSHWCIVSIHWALIAVVVLHPCNSLGLKGAHELIRQKYSHTNYYFVICHLGLVSLLANCKAADVLVQSLQVHSYPASGSANQNTLFSAPSKLRLNPRGCKPECCPKINKKKVRPSSWFSCSHRATHGWNRPCSGKLQRDSQIHFPCSRFLWLYAQDNDTPAAQHPVCLLESPASIHLWCFSTLTQQRFDHVLLLSPPRCVCCTFKVLRPSQVFRNRPIFT